VPYSEGVSPRRASARGGVLITVAAILIAGAVIIAVPSLREALSSALSGDTAELRSELRGAGIGGVLLGLILAHAVVFYPAEIVNAAAGYVYGFGPALVLCMAGWTVSSLAAYAIGRWAGRPLVYSLVGERRFVRAQAAVDRAGTVGLIAARLIPILPFSLVCYVFGAARIPLWRYVWTTFVGTLPLCATVVYLGGKLDTLSVNDPAVWLATAVVVALLLSGHLLRGRLRAPREPDEAQPSTRTSGPTPSGTGSAGEASSSPQPHSHARASTSPSGP
jgi:uncharacterized membrane protein YdjX (TVP38/TMEM64 family)